jgi:hypothetical protein
MKDIQEIFFLRICLLLVVIFTFSSLQIYTCRTNDLWFVLFLNEFRYFFSYITGFSSAAVPAVAGGPSFVGVLTVTCEIAVEDVFLLLLTLYRR